MDTYHKNIEEARGFLTNLGYTGLNYLTQWESGASYWNTDQAELLVRIPTADTDEYIVTEIEKHKPETQQEEEPSTVKRKYIKSTDVAWLLRRANALKDYSHEYTHAMNLYQDALNAWMKNNPTAFILQRIDEIRLEAAEARLAAAKALTLDLDEWMDETKRGQLHDEKIIYAQGLERDANKIEKNLDS